MNPSKPAPTLRSSAPEVPARLVEFVTQQLPRAKTFTLVQQTMGQPQIVDSWPRGGEKLKAPELAAEIWALALEDGGSLGLLSGAPKYAILVAPREGEGGARLGFGLPSKTTAELGSPLQADAQGAVAQTMAHLAMREASSQAMMIEGLETLFAGNKHALDEMQKARARDLQTFEATIAAYQQLLAAQGSGNKIAQESANEQIRVLSRAYNEQAAKAFELLPMLEALSSSKHERDLELARQSRSDDRKDKVIDQAQRVIFPALAAKVAGVLSPAKGGPGPGPGAPAPPAAPSGMVSQPTVFGPRVLRALEAFLPKLTGPEVDGITRALTPENVKLFDELAHALMSEAVEANERTAKATNGATAAKEASA